MSISRKEFVKEWIKDLRSGQYSQTTEVLCDVNGYCCLGVACETGRRLGIAGAGFNCSESEQDTMDEYPGLWFIDIMNRDDPKILGMTCSEANDTHSMCFNRIADLLEEEYLNES